MSCDVMRRVYDVDCRVIMAGFTAVQPFADTFLFFIPFYYSLKLAFACYLWANNLQGTKMVYYTYVQPFLERHEPAVDGKLAHVKALVSDVVSSNVTRVVQYVQMTLINALRQNMDDGNLKAHTMGHAAPAAGYSKSDSFKSAHSSGSGFFQKTFSLSEKDE